MNKVVVIEKLKCLRCEMNHLLASIFIFGGTGIFLLYTNSRPFNFILGLSGIVFSFIFLKTYIVRRLEILKALENLEKNNEF